MIQSIAFTVYPVKDMAKARKFYEEVLGLKMTHDFRGVWVEYDLGDTTFALSTMDTSREAGAKGALVAFEVTDFNAEVTRLKQLNAPFNFDPFETPVCHMAVLQDPDGNDVMIHKRKVNS